MENSHDAQTPFDTLCVEPGEAHPDPDPMRDTAQIDDTEQTTLAAIERAMPAHAAPSIITLGKLERSRRTSACRGS